MLLTAFGLTEENKEASESAMFTVVRQEWRRDGIPIRGLFSSCKSFHGCIMISEAVFLRVNSKHFSSLLKQTLKK